MSNAIDNFAMLKKAKTLAEVHESAYFQEHFVKRYIDDIPRMAFEIFNTKLTWQQIEILEAHEWEGGRVAVPSGHGSGKTRLIGIIAAAHLLLFKGSITRIQAPKVEQVIKYSFKEISTALNALTAPRKINGKVKLSKWSFLHKFIQVNTTKIYVKKFSTEWYIEPATAPKGDPTNLSGQHNWAYLLIFDEASGIPDTHIAGSLGALTDKFNSCIMFSQHTRTSGKFHDFVTTQSEDVGGVWKVIRLNSEESPRVTDEAIAAWRATYTENEYNVRVLGLQPEYEDGYLLSHEEAMKAYSEPAWYKDFEPSYRVQSTDVAYKAIRDSSATSGFDVLPKRNKRGEVVLYVVVTNIDVFVGRNKRLPTQMSKTTLDSAIKWADQHKDEARRHMLAMDASAGGHEAYIQLRDAVDNLGDHRFSTYGIEWASQRMSGSNKRRFYNQRAMANVLFHEAVKDGRLYIRTKKHQMRVLRELSHIPFKFTGNFKYLMMGKDEMAKNGISSPDIADTMSQIFLLPYDEKDYGAVENTVIDVDEDELGDPLGDLEEETIEDEDILGDTLGDLEGTTIM